MRVVNLEIEDIAFGGKGGRREQAKAVVVRYTSESEPVAAEIVRGQVRFARADRHEVNHALAELRAQPRVRDGHYTLRASAGARVFSQTNDEVANALRDLIVNLVPPNQPLLIDAYCGAGFFTKALLDKFERVIGIDWDKFAIAAAKQNATDKETYIASDVEEELASVSRNDGFLAVEGETRRLGSRHSLTLIVDPPATGLSADVRKTIV